VISAVVHSCESIKEVDAEVVSREDRVIVEVVCAIRRARASFTETLAALR